MVTFGLDNLVLPTRASAVVDLLIQKCIEGDSAAWTEFLHKYRSDVESAVRRTFQRCLGRVPTDDVENVTQDLYARLCDQGYRRLRSFQGRCPMALWLKTLAIRMTLNYVTSEKRRGRFGGGLLEQMPLDAPSDRGESAPAAEREEFRRLSDLMGQLEALERTLLQMFYFDGLTYRQMSSLLGIPVQTLGSILSRARAKIRKLRGALEKK